MTSSSTNSQPLLLFVTGRLAEASLREVLGAIAPKAGFRFEVVVPGIQVAALLHSRLLLKRLTVPAEIDRVILPGWCQGDLHELEQHFGKPFERGPRDLHDLPEYFGLSKRRKADLTGYSIEIIAEINHATRMPLKDVVREALSLSASGANLIDVGGVPGESSPRITEIVSALRQEGLRVSIDSFDRNEVEQAVTSGAELILSCNHANIDWVTQLKTEVVVIPDTPQDMQSLDDLIEQLRSANVPFRVDPIIEPIGMGFAASLDRYLKVRQKYPDIPMMMGVGNVTELTEVDSVGVNIVLAAFCEELGIQSILTTQVINWCRSAVREFDMARRLVHHAVAARTIPKHLDSSLVMLRDSRLRSVSAQTLQTMASALTDTNFRIFAEAGQLHLMNRHGHWSGNDVFRLFEQSQAVGMAHGVTMDPSHAFYLGYELARAEIALHLGKQYVQDAPMQWGLLGELKAGSSSAMHGADGQNR